MGVYGCKKGVRRGVTRAGYIPVNGHRPVSPPIRERVLAEAPRGRTFVVAEIIGLLPHYSPNYVRQVVRNMAIDGDLTWPVRANGLPNVYALPEAVAEPTKKCCACKQQRPTSAFHRDSNTPDGLYPRCRTCRGVLRPRRNHPVGAVA